MSEQGGPSSGASRAKADTRSLALAASLGLAAVGVVALLYVVFAPAAKPDPQGFGQFAKGSLENLVSLEAPPPQPIAVLRDAEGRGLTLQAFGGQVVLVNLWATWCGPCREEMPKLAALARAYEGRGFKVVAVSVDAEADWPKARAMLAELSDGRLGFFTEPTRTIAFAVKAPGMPISILYDRNGREIARVPGYADWEGPEAGALIEAALAGK